jgi:hypothetical protein
MWTTRSDAVLPAKAVAAAFAFSNATVETFSTLLWLLCNGFSTILTLDSSVERFAPMLLLTALTHTQFCFLKAAKCELMMVSLDMACASIVM